jgi:excisionase family DNA binding protein
MPAASASGYLTTGEAASRIGATSQYVRDLIRAGALEAIDISNGGRAVYRVAESSIAKFLTDRAVRSAVAEVA